ncbi:MAG: hypothetical protein HY763_11920 [Planctomycetes bacterium]|nr:hypothetical protein [Planctomycetota bacterium]
MDLLRRHLFLLLCAVGAGLGVALIATGLRAMPKVAAEMDKAKGLYTELSALQNNPANAKAIEAENQRIAAVKADYRRVLDEAAKLYRYTPLLPDVFPSGNDEQRREFRRRYGVAMNELLKVLRGGQPATASDIELMKDKIANERRRAEESSQYTGAVPSQPATATPRTAAGILTRFGARENAAVRAHLAAAQKIYCYITGFEAAESKASGTGKAVPSLDFDSAMRDTGTIEAPTPEDCWRAQVGYWIQKDVVEAIAALNNEAAETLAAGEQDRWVGVMPVKEIIAIRTSQDYVPEGGEFYAGGKPGDFAPALPPATGASVFTGTGSGPTYEVMQFTVKLIMDQRDILRFVEKLSANSFHTLVRIAYRAAPPNKEMTEKIYGAEPVVNVVMDFETVMLGDVFRKLMPASVCEHYKIECPKHEDEPDKG